MIEPTLTTTSLEYWPINARNIMTEKGIDPDQLKSVFKKILFPWNKKYNTDRMYFSLRIQQRPLFIVKPISISEIETILDYVTCKNLTVRIVNGRHSSALVQSEVLINMSSSSFLNKCLSNTLIAGAGNTQGDLNEYLFNHNGFEHYSHFGSFVHPRVDTDAFPGGSAASVGIGGISCVGGIGTLCRTYSLTIDSVKSYTVTLCPNDTHYAQTVIASKHENQDLFWALRGGMASNFGVVSQIVYEIIEVPDIVQYSIVWPWGQATKILKKWQDTSITRPVNFNEDLILFHNPQTTHGIELSGIYVNIHNKSTRTIVSEIHEEVDMLGGILTIQPKTKYSNLYRNLVKNRIYYNYSIIQPMFVDRVSPKYIVKMLNESINLKSPVSITLTLLGGNICNKSASDTAFYPRNKRFFIDPAAFWNDITETSIMEGWIKNIVSYLIDIKEVVAYVGFPITFNDIKFDNSIYYGKNYDRLLEIKNMYDPLNILTSCGTL